jgi:tripartite-type tricarboxylate transporter receptor subunit TctC
MTMSRISVALLGLLVVAPIAALTTARADEWPSRTIRFIVPFAAGGSTDVGARLIASVLSRTLHQQVVVEDRSGADGNIGMEAAAKSAPDGYTVLVTTDQIASTAHIFRLNFDPAKDFIPVIQISRQPVVLAVHASLGINTLADFIALAKRQPGMSFATSGVGSQQQMVAEWFARIAGIKLEHVPYRGGGQAINDLVAGHVKVASLGSSPLIPHYKAGTIKLLAQSTATRSPSLPDVPTYEEAGIKGLVLAQWLGVFVPAGTPAPIVARLNAEINKALAQPDIRAKLLTAAQEPIGGTADAFAKLFHDDDAKYARLVKQLNIHVQ